MTRRFGFTLAEVLITLGIIGVVAAMTIPTLIANTNGAKFRSQFKKTISTLNQAGLMSQAQYDFDYAGTTGGSVGEGDKKQQVACVNGASDHPEEVMTFCAILNGTLTGQTYLGPVSSIKRSSNGAEVDYSLVSKSTIADDYTNYIAYALADGAIVAFNPNAMGCTVDIGTQITGDLIGGAVKDKDGNGGKDAGQLNKCIGFIDVNGTTLPNKEVSCTSTTADNRAVETPCAVKNDANHMTDVFPIFFHDATVEPASAAAKYVLTTSK